MTKTPIEFLQHILESVHRIEMTVIGIRPEIFKGNYQIYDVVIRETEVIGEACKHLEKQFHKQYPQIPWAEIIATRNNLIHEYWNIDLDELWHTATVDIPQLKHLLEPILHNLESQSPQSPNQ